MKKRKENIIYIKNGQEIKQTLSPFNKKQIYQEIFEPTSSKTHYYVKSDIERIKFINVVLKMDFLHCKKGTTCILRNCIAKPIKEASLTLVGNSFQLINPSNISIDFVQELEMNYSKLRKNNPIKNIDDKILINNVANKVSISDNQKIKEIGIEAEQITLEGTFELQHLKLKADKITIGGSNEVTQIIIKEEAWCNRRIEAEVLELNNCIIQNTSENIPLYINTDKILGTNYIIKSKSNIVLKDKVNNQDIVFSTKDKDGYITITKEKVLRRNLLSNLKRVKNIVMEQQEKQAEFLAKETENKNLTSQIEAKEQELEKRSEEKTVTLEELTNIKMELDSLKYQQFCQNRTKKAQIRKKLSKKPIKYFFERKSNNQ